MAHPYRQTREIETLPVVPTRAVVLVCTVAAIIAGVAISVGIGQHFMTRARPKLETTPWTCVSTMPPDTDPPK